MPAASAAALPGCRAPSRPVVLSYGLGVDSTAVLTRWLLDPASRNFDLADLIVLTAMTGDEWPDTGRLVEQHVLPLLRAHRVRHVQVARAGASIASDGIAVLDDSTAPARLHLRGAYRLSQELRTAGTVPQAASGRRLCSVHAKGEVLDRAIHGLLGDTPYTHVMGFSSEERRRAAKDTSYAGTPKKSGPALDRAPAYPLIEWGWDRATSEAYLLAQHGAAWPKSACTYCPFALHARDNERIFRRYLDLPEAAVDALLTEYAAMCLNPAQTLTPGQGLRQMFQADRRFDQILADYAAARDAAEHSLFEVRRVFPGGRAPARRSTVKLGTGTRAEMNDLLLQRALTAGADSVTYRAWIRHRPEPGQAGVEHLLAVAPSWIAEKQRTGFDAAWDRAMAAAGDRPGLWGAA